jgi:hypothetical protein
MNTSINLVTIFLTLFFKTATTQFHHGITPILVKPSITTLTIKCIDIHTIQRSENIGKFLIFIIPKGHHVAVKKVYACLPGKIFKLKFKYELESIKVKGLKPLCHSKFKLHAYGCYSLLEIFSETVKYVGQNVNHGGAVLFSKNPAGFDRVVNGHKFISASNKFSLNQFGSTIKFPSHKKQFKAFTSKYSWKLPEKVLVKKFGNFAGIAKKLLSPIIVTSQISKFSFGPKSLIDQVWGFGFTEKPGLCDGKSIGLRGETLGLCELFPVKFNFNSVGGENPVLFDVNKGLKQPIFKQPLFKQPVFKQPVFKQPVFELPTSDPTLISIDPFLAQPPVKIFTDQIGPNKFIESATDDTFTEEIISPDYVSTDYLG